MIESAMQALERLKERNQALVNKLGKTTAYSRESDEIITVLARALWSLSDADRKLSKYFVLGDILGVDLENGIDRIPEEVLQLVKNGCDSYRLYKHDAPTGEPIPFNKENASELMWQLFDASDTWHTKERIRKQRNEDDLDLIAHIPDDPDSVAWLRKEIAERDRTKDLL